RAEPRESLADSGLVSSGDRELFAPAKPKSPKASRRVRRQWTTEARADCIGSSTEGPHDILGYRYHRTRPRQRAGVLPLRERQRDVRERAHVGRCTNDGHSHPRGAILVRDVARASEVSGVVLTAGEGREGPSGSGRLEAQMLPIGHHEAA